MGHQSSSWCELYGYSIFFFKPKRKTRHTRSDNSYFIPNTLSPTMTILIAKFKYGKLITKFKMDKTAQHPQRITDRVMLYVFFAALVYLSMIRICKLSQND